jgi:hypothetical protein
MTTASPRVVAPWRRATSSTTTRTTRTTTTTTRAVRATDAADAVVGRRQALRAASFAVATVLTSSPSSSALASYLPPSAAPTFGGAFPQPPEPVKFPRSKISVPFAVLLLRSAYEAIDDADVMAMDAFQATSWKLRRNEWEAYKYLYDPIKIEQGAIGDPLYFDFVSFVQMATIAREIPKSSAVFEEKSGAEGTSTIIRRDAALRDNATLPEAIAEGCGRKIYARLRDGFDRGEDFEVETFAGVPSTISTSTSMSTKERLDASVEGLRALSKVFVDNGYALKIVVDGDAGGGAAVNERRVRVRVDGPATLWGARELISRGYNAPSNDYLAFTMCAFLEQSNVASSYTERVGDAGIDLNFILTA